MQVFDQCSDPLIEPVELRRKLDEVPAVAVPASERKRHAAAPASTKRRASRNWSIQCGPASSPKAGAALPRP